MRKRLVFYRRTCWCYCFDAGAESSTGQVANAAVAEAVAASAPSLTSVFHPLAASISVSRSVAVTGVLSGAASPVLPAADSASAAAAVTDRRTGVMLACQNPVRFV